MRVMMVMVWLALLLTPIQAEEGGATTALSTPLEPLALAQTVRLSNPTLADSRLVVDPKLPEGFFCRFRCLENTRWIAPDGRLTFPDLFTAVRVKVEVIRDSDRKSAESRPFNLLIPARIVEHPPALRRPYQALRYGLFIHWVGGDNLTGDSAGLVRPDGSRSRGIDMYCNEMNLEKVVADVARLGFEVVYVTDFHGLGTTLHPSAAVDHWRGEGRYTAKRDLIGELIRKLKKHGIYVVLFTHPLDGHDYGKEQQEKLGWNDPSGGFKRWNDFVNDAYADIVSRYGKDIVGLGFDGAWGVQAHEQMDGEGKLDRIRLRETIKRYAPSLPLISLCPPNETSDLYIREVWRPYWFNWDRFPKITRNFTRPVEGKQSPAFDPADFNTDLWPSYNRPPAVVITDHWTVTQPRDRSRLSLGGAAMFRYTVFQHSAAYNGPAVLWAVSPYVTGDWPMDVYEQFVEVDRLMAPVRDSLKGTYPSTSFVTPEGESIQSLANGFVATRSPDNSGEYIHVLRPPAGKVLTLGKPADGKEFDAVGRLLPSGAKVMVSQDGSGYWVTLGEQLSWDPLDTVIKLVVRQPPRENIALFKPVVAFSSSDETGGLSANAFWHAGLTDGRNNKAWSSKEPIAAAPQWITIDLLKPCKIRRVVLLAYGGEYPTDFTIETSTDSQHFSIVAKHESQVFADRRCDCDFKPIKARYVRVTATKTRSVPAIPLEVGKASGLFRLQEIEVYE